ncbi:hypothetical protein ROHU_005870 [Labeo rohita]|uniref:Uncharacterized protein n=1 Tax=Labeo rohita TaxID=84645 RepID=A0A498N0C2_LABRO|nr:hypothetical protein ROHU_005870 [Labeo rohita]
MLTALCHLWGCPAMIVQPPSASVREDPMAPSLASDPLALSRPWLLPSLAAETLCIAVSMGSLIHRLPLGQSSLYFCHRLTDHLLQYVPSPIWLQRVPPTLVIAESSRSPSVPSALHLHITLVF